MLPRDMAVYSQWLQLYGLSLLCVLKCSVLIAVLAAFVRLLAIFEMRLQDMVHQIPSRYSYIFALAGFGFSSRCVFIWPARLLEK